MRLAGSPRDPDDRAAGPRLPVRRAESHERGDEDHTASVGHLTRELLGLGGASDEPQAVAQPLQRSAGDEHAPLERVHRRARGAARHRHEQTMLGCRSLAAGVEEQECAGPIGVLRLARAPAALSEQRGLLVAGDAGDRQLSPQVLAAARAERTARRPDFGERMDGDLEEAQQVGIPGPRVDVV